MKNKNKKDLTHPGLKPEPPDESPDYIGAATLTSGDYFLDDRGDVLRLKIEKKKFVVEHYWDGEWHRYGSFESEAEFRKKNYLRIFSPEQAEAEAMRLLEQGIEEDEAEQELSDDTTLAASQSLDSIQALKSATLERHRQMELIQRVMARKLADFRSVQHELNETLRRINRVIWIIELYLGVFQEVVLLRDGRPSQSPIHIRQLVLYMDEEVGDVHWHGDHKGLDFRDVADFDKWLLQGDHLNHVLPEEKGVMALRPSRQNRVYYRDDAYMNSLLNSENDNVYILIRNGEQVYRIWTGIKMSEKWLFPAAGGLGKKEGDYFGQRNQERAAETYRATLTILQGILDRTEALAPLPTARVNLQDPETYQGQVVLVRDGEPSLTDGQPTYKQWREAINASITRGTRLFVISPQEVHSGYINAKEYKYRFNRYYERDADLPALPPTGIYSVEDVKDDDKKKLFLIYYNPGDKVYWGGGWDGHARKNRVGFWVYGGDIFVLNYDAIDVELCRYFFHSRLERGDYLTILPALRDIILEREREAEWEAHFVGLVASRTGATVETVWEAVTWWKTKNIWKRPIRQDDALALRMIEKKVKP